MIEVKKKELNMHVPVLLRIQIGRNRIDKPNKTNKMTVHSFYFYKNIFYKDIEADISLILRWMVPVFRTWEVW